jgi:hypothetical protein
MEGILSGRGEEVFHPDRSGVEARGEMDVDMDFVSLARAGGRR